MGNKLYVGNLPYSVRDGDLEQAFGAFGAVTSAKVMMERDTARKQGNSNDKSRPPRSSRGEDRCLVGGS